VDNWIWILSAIPLGLGLINGGLSYLAQLVSDFTEPEEVSVGFCLKKRKQNRRKKES
jgi:hypothetical protein